MANELMLRPEAPVRHVYEWQTDVIRSYNGTEQRIAARLRPRQRLEFTVLLHNDDEIRRWHRFLASSTVGQVTIPAWHDAISVSSSVAAGVTTIPGDFATSDIAAGDTVVLVPPGDGNGTEDSGWEYGTVDSISDTQVVLTGVTTLALPVGSVVAPAITGKFTGSAGYRQHPQGAAVLPVTLTVDQQSTIGGNGGTAISTYQGLNVLDRRPLNNSLLETSFHQDVELIDFGHKFSLNTDETPSRTRTRRVYQIETREELQFWRLFLSACVGRREPFYAPTYRPDLAVVSNTASAVVVSDDFETWYADMNCRDHLQVETDDGSVSQHYISGVADNMDGTWTLNVDGTISGNVLTCSFLEVVRLGSDVVLFEHFGHRSQVSVTLETVDELQTVISGIQYMESLADWNTHTSMSVTAGSLWRFDQSSGDATDLGSYGVTLHPENSPTQNIDDADLGICVGFGERSAERMTSDDNTEHDLGTSESWVLGMVIKMMVDSTSSNNTLGGKRKTTSHFDGYRMGYRPGPGGPLRFQAIFDGDGATLDVENLTHDAGEDERVIVPVIVCDYNADNFELLVWDNGTVYSSGGQSIATTISTNLEEFCIGAITQTNNAAGFRCGQAWMLRGASCEGFNSTKLGALATGMNLPTS